MSILKYEVISPVTNRKKPYIDNRGAFIIPAIKRNYKYYIEVKRYNPANLSYEYFLILSITKFDSQCRKCRVDDYGRLKLILHGDFKDYVSNEAANRGNVEFEYVESESEYDVWQVY